MNNLISRGPEVGPIVKGLLQQYGKKQGDLCNYLGITDNGFRYKIKSGYFSQEELNNIASFFGTDTSVFGNKLENDNSKSDQYLQDYLMKIENEWKSIVAEKDNIIAEYKDIIKDLKQSRAAGQSNFLKPAPNKTYWLDSKQIKRLPVAGAVAGRRA